MSSIKKIAIFLLAISQITVSTLFANTVNLQTEWKNEYKNLQQQIQKIGPKFKGWNRLNKEVLNEQSLIWISDKTPVDIALRRTKALLNDLKENINKNTLQKINSSIQKLEKQNTPDNTEQQQMQLFYKICKVRRFIAFKNPLLNFNKILFLKHHKMGFGEIHMVDQYLGFNAKKGGGVFVLHNPFSDKTRKCTPILDNSIVNRGRLKGQKLNDGSFISLDLDYDAQTIAFAYTEAARDIPPNASWKNQGWSKKECKSRGKRYQQYYWRPESTYHIYKAKIDGTNLEQLTDSQFNDYDPCFLPNGRIAFISERCGGNQRCGARWGPTATLHAMMNDGSDIIQLSWHDTNEWHPSVDNNGMIVYTRWDYVDRDSDVAHHLWYCYPDGRDPRSSHGNYPIQRSKRPWMELSIRAIPNSQKYIATAAPHHGEAYGSLIIIDQKIPDDRIMSQIKRITPEVRFPESEMAPGVARLGGYKRPKAEVYGTPWPLSENYYLCVYDTKQTNYAICLVDCFGNKEIIYRDKNIACLDPIPLRPRKSPPILPILTKQAKADRIKNEGETKADDLTGTIAIMNIYEAEYPFPKNTKIKELRIVSIYPKPNAFADRPRIGHADQALARGVLGTVPVEEDGSVYFKVPTGTAIYFQALDEKGEAVQTMRSDTYVHPGERLSCIGCHESKFNPPKNTLNSNPIAFRRPPSTIIQEVEGANPLTFPRLVQPVLDKHCLKCHQAHPRKAPNLSGKKFGRNGWSQAFISLHRYGWGKHGGNGGLYKKNKLSYSLPGKIGAKQSRLLKLLNNGHGKVKLTPQEKRRITLWIDCNTNYYGAYLKPKAQSQGKVVIPKHGYKKTVPPRKASNQLSIRACNVIVTPSTGPVTIIKIENKNNKPVSGKLKVTFPKNWQVNNNHQNFNIPARETKSLSFSITEAIDLAANKYPLKLELTIGEEKKIYNQTIVCATAPYYKPKIDGKLKEWKDSVPINFTCKNKNTKVQLYWNKKQFCLAIVVEEQKLIGTTNSTPKKQVDAIQFALSPANSKTAKINTPSNRYEFLAIAGQGWKKDKCYTLLKYGEKVQLTKKLENAETKDAKIKVTRKKQQTIYEIAIPMKQLKKLKASAGREFNFSLLVHDPDGTGIRDLGSIMNLDPNKKTTNNWTSWKNSKLNNKKTFNNKIEFGFSSSIH